MSVELNFLHDPLLVTFFSLFLFDSVESRNQQCVSLVLSLISSSLDAWRTRQYDYYQRVLNGIL